MTVARDFQILFVSIEPTRALIHTQKYFRIRFRFRQVVPIRISTGRYVLEWQVTKIIMLGEF
jgi:hypothetical protein